jgi:hypothetical protein
MANGSVSINSEVVSSILASLSSVYSTFSSDIVSSVDSDFQVLKDLGFTNCLDKIKSQATSLSESQKTIIDSIASHLSEVEDTEQKLNNKFTNSYSGGSYAGSSSGGGDSEGSSYDVDDDDDGKKINADNFSEVFEALTDDEKKNLLTLLNTNKDENISINDLLMNYENSEELFKLLKSILGDSVEFDDLTKEDMEVIQKTLLNSIVSGETEYQELKTDSILMAKEYLKKVCNDYKIDASDLIYDSLYRNVLKTSLKNLYTGNTDYEISDEDITNFRDYIDKVALENNTNAIDLIENNIEKLL